MPKVVPFEFPEKGVKLTIAGPDFGAAPGIIQLPTCCIPVHFPLTSNACRNVPSTAGAPGLKVIVVPISMLSWSIVMLVSDRSTERREF